MGHLIASLACTVLALPFTFPLALAVKKVVRGDVA